MENFEPKPPRREARSEAEGDTMYILSALSTFKKTGALDSLVRDQSNQLESIPYLLDSFADIKTEDFGITPEELPGLIARYQKAEEEFWRNKEVS